MGRLSFASCLLALGMALGVAAEKATEVEVSLDVREADIRSIVQALADLGDVQVILDPGVSCRLTLSVRGQPLQKTLDVSLRACGLASEHEGRVLRIATPLRLAEEAKARRELREAQERARPVTTTAIRLSYARAQELAPLLEKLLSPRGRVVLDARTNTLLIID